MNPSVRQNLTLRRQQRADPAGGQIEQRIELGPADRALLGGTLELDNRAGTSLDDVAVEVGGAVLAVVQVEQRGAVDVAGADGGDSLDQRVCVGPTVPSTAVQRQR